MQAGTAQRHAHSARDLDLEAGESDDGKAPYVLITCSPHLPCTLDPVLIDLEVPTGHMQMMSAHAWISFLLSPLML